MYREFLVETKLKNTDDIAHFVMAARAVWPYFLPERR